MVKEDIITLVLQDYRLAGNMHPYFRFYHERLITGLVIAGIIFFIHIIMEVAKWIVQFIRG